MIGIAPATVDQKLPNNQRIPGAGWFLYMGNCTLYTGGPPRLKQASVGFPDTAVGEGGEVTVVRRHLGLSSLTGDEDNLCQGFFLVRLAAALSRRS